MFCIGIFFVTAIVRRAVEIYLPGFAARNQWKKVWLPSLPVIIGSSAAAIMHAYPFLSSLPTWGTRAFYGAVAGGLSSFMYKVLQAVIQAKLGVKVSESDSPGPVNPDTVETAPPGPLSPMPHEEHHEEHREDEHHDECAASGDHTLPPLEKKS
jgi:hypothetical protein